MSLSQPKSVSTPAAGPAPWNKPCKLLHHNHPAEAETTGARTVNILKHTSIAVLGFGFLGTQACTAGSVAEEAPDLGSVGQNICYDNNGVNSMLAALAVAMADEVGELNPVRDLEIDTSSWKIRLSSTGRNKCNANHGCQNTDAILDMQNSSVNNVVSTSLFDATNFRNTLVASYQRQLDWEHNLEANNPGALPEDHRLVFSNQTDNGSCGPHYVFNAFKANCSGGSGAFTESGGQVVMEAEHFDSINLHGSYHNWSNVGNGSASGGQVMQIGPDWSYAWTSNVNTYSPTLEYRVNFSSTGTYTLWVRGMAIASAGGTSDSVYGGIDGNANMQYLDFPENGSLAWISKTISVSSTGVHTVNLFAREDGFYADKIVLTKNGNVPSGAGPGESARGSSSGGSCLMDDPADIENRLTFFKNGNNPFLAFYSTASQIGLDPTGTMNGGGGDSSGTCTASATAFDPTFALAGTCCTVNGQYGTFQSASFNPKIFLCRF